MAQVINIPRVLSKAKRDEAVLGETYTAEQVAATLKSSIAYAERLMKGMEKDEQVTVQKRNGRPVYEFSKDGLYTLDREMAKNLGQKKLDKKRN